MGGPLKNMSCLYRNCHYQDHFIFIIMRFTVPGNVVFLLKLSPAYSWSKVLFYNDGIPRPANKPQSDVTNTITSSPLLP